VTRIVTGDDVRTAVIDTLTTHLPNVLDDLGDLELPAVHEAPTVDAARLDAAQLPLLVVVTTGFTSAPTRDEAGVFTGVFGVLVEFFIRSAEGTYGATARDARRYAAAIRTVLVERSTLDGYAQDVEVVDEGYDDGDPAAARTFAIGQVACLVTVWDINRSGSFFTEPGGASVATETVVTVQPY